MPFTLIKGTFRLVNRSANNQQTGFQPDGDSIHFKPQNAKLLDQLERLSRPYRLTRIGSVMLRFEGIDALELHYQPTGGGANSHQPRPLADLARDFLTGECGLNPVPYAAPKLISVKPPVPVDGTPGYILSRSLEVNGRPVSFAFAGSTQKGDGSQVHLTPALLKESLNYGLVANGHAYPLFYETLFSDLRDALAKAAAEARAKRVGLWAADRSQTGVKATKQSDLESDGVTFPKLFRRLTDFLSKGGAVKDFKEFLAKTKEQVQDLTASSPHFTHFDNLVQVQGNKVSLTQQAETMVFISAKSQPPAARVMSSGEY